MSSSAVSVASSATGDLNTLGASAAKSMEHCANGTLHRRQLRLPLSQPRSNPFRTHFRVTAVAGDNHMFDEALLMSELPDLISASSSSADEWPTASSGTDVPARGVRPLP